MLQWGVPIVIFYVVPSERTRPQSSHAYLHIHVLFTEIAKIQPINSHPFHDCCILMSIKCRSAYAD